MEWIVLFEEKVTFCAQNSYIFIFLVNLQTSKSGSSSLALLQIRIYVGIFHAASI